MQTRKYVTRKQGTGEGWVKPARQGSAIILRRCREGSTRGKIDFDREEKARKSYQTPLGVTKTNLTVNSSLPAVSMPKLSFLFDQVITMRELWQHI